MDGVLDTYEKAFFTNNPIGTRPDLVLASQEGLSCKQKCIRNRHCIWTVALSFGVVVALAGAGFCISQKSNLLIPGVIMTLCGMAAFVGALLFAGCAESIANEPRGLPPVEIPPPQPQPQPSESRQQQDEMNDDDFY